MSSASRVLHVTWLTLWAALAFAPCAAWAYNEPGHMESVRLIVEASLQVPQQPDGPGVHPLQSKEKGLIEFCSQLPDLSEELDATRTYTHAVGQWSLPVAWVSWGWFNHPVTDQYRRMIVVQQTVHALTGGDALAMRRVAIISARSLLSQAAAIDPEREDRTVPLCAIGLALHLFGDTFAHTVMPWNGGKPTAKLYPTGRGHAFDSHYPDYILCNSLAKDWGGNTNCGQSRPDASDGIRFRAWVTYWSGAQPAINDIRLATTPWSAIGPDPALLSGDHPLMPGIQSAVLTVQSGKKEVPADTADTNVGLEIRKTLSAVNPPAASSAAVDKVVADSRGSTFSAKGCRIVLHDGATALGFQRAKVLDADNCALLWQAYYPLVIRAMNDCQNGENPNMPECVAGQGPVDRAWARWLKDERQGLVRFAGLVIFK